MFHLKVYGFSYMSLCSSDIQCIDNLNCIYNSNGLSYCQCDENYIWSTTSNYCSKLAIYIILYNVFYFGLKDKRKERSVSFCYFVKLSQNTQIIFFEKSIKKLVNILNFKASLRLLIILRS